MRFVLCLLPVVGVWLWFVDGVLRATGGVPCPILDDAFILFQYARSFARCEPLAYHPGAPPTTGATSILYPALLAPGYWIGLRGLAIMWFGYALSGAFVAASMVVAWRFAERFGHRALGPIAALSVIACPTYVLLCLGGMEVGVASSLHLIGTLAAASWILVSEARTGRGAMARALGLVVLGGLSALGRPEGVAAAGACALALVVFPPLGLHRARALGPLAVLPAAVPAAVAFATEGTSSTNGMLLKFVPSRPCSSRDHVVDAVTENAGVLWNEMFAGLPAQFLPYQAVPGCFRYLAILGGLALPGLLVLRRGRSGALAAAAYWLGASALAFPLLYTALGLFGRYVFPFVPLIVLAAVIGLGGLVATVCETLRLRPLVTGTLTATFGLALTLLFVVAPSEARTEHVRASRQTCEQQLAMARRVRALPAGSVIALNNAGAIAYLGGHRTWDLVGLTSPGAVRARVAGVGSVFERMEHLPPEERPTHVSFYPAWFPGLDFHGRRLFGARVGEGYDTIYLGGEEEELFEVRTELFGSGERPRTPTSGTLVDAFDAADLSSEAAHAYRARSQCEIRTLFRLDPGAEPLADGGRALRRDRFLLWGSEGRDGLLVSRIEVVREGALSVVWNGTLLEETELLPGEGIIERVLRVPAECMRAQNEIERRMSGTGMVITLHDWLYQ